MEVVERIETAIAMVEEARGVPLSASCVLHRGEILELLDGLSESYAGIFGRLKGYEVHETPDWTSTADTIAYYKNCYDWLVEERKTAPQESWIQNQLDEIAQLLGETLYLLTLK
jgi:hypothetical protein